MNNMVIHRDLDCGCTAQVVSRTRNNLYYKVSGRDCTSDHEIGEFELRRDDPSRKELEMIKEYVSSKKCTIPHYKGEYKMVEPIKCKKSKIRVGHFGPPIKYTPQEVKISLMKLFEFGKIGGKLHFHSIKGKKVESYVGIDELRYYIVNNYCLCGGKDSTEFARKVSEDINKNVRDMKF